jgi:two-component system response regulator HydG
VTKVVDEDVATALREGTDAALHTARSFTVTVLDGAERGKAFELDGTQPARVLVGKSPACEIRLKDPEVSRRHAALDASRGVLHLSDLGSTNGTFVNGVRVVEAFVGDGDVVRLGDTTLRVDAKGTALDVPLSKATGFGAVLGSSVEMRRLYPLCERLAQSDVPLVIEGETGTGKEVLAEALHEASPRAAGPFIVFDCTAVPPTLAESELFGHERGAFTGAVSTRKGVFELAHGGTLLIDEIGELDLQLQPKLLRALERSEVRKVGSDRWMRVDVRVMAATRRDLDREVSEGRFRDDLFFRLAVTRVELPPLRMRRGDIGVLARHFWRELGGGDSPIPYAVLQAFESHSWPGNVRELRNAVARRLALGELTRDERGLIEGGGTGDGDAIERVLGQHLPFPRARETLVREFERRYVERVLEEHGGNVSKAARASGIARRYFTLIRARMT